PALWPWTPPKDVITSEMIAELVSLVGIGINGEPYSPTIGAYDRSISRPCERLGIATSDGQKEALKSIKQAGVEVADYKTANRKTAKGLRHPDGRPNVAWADQ